jgi:uncharacterized protein YggE
MHETTTKQFHRQRSICAITVIALAASAAAVAQDSPRTITVVGHGSVAAAPDLAVVELTVESTAATAGAAASANAETTTAVLEAVRERLADEDEVSTARYSLDPRYARRQPGSSAPPDITGYVARNQVRARIHDPALIGGLLDAAIAAGANRSSGLRFVLEDRAPHLRLALAEAGRDARAQADSVAAALGVELGEILQASSAAPPPAPVRLEAQRMAMAADATPIEPGDVTVNATLTVTYRID